MSVLGYRWRRLLRADRRMVRTEGDGDWHAFILMLLTWNITLILTSLNVWYGHGCTGLVIMASVFMWSKTNRPVGSSMKMYGLYSVVFVFLPPVVALTLVGGLISPLAEGLIALFTLLPFIFLVGTPGIGLAAKTFLSIAGYEYLNNRQASGPLIAALLRGLYSIVFTSIGCMMLFTVLVCPASSYVRARVMLSYTIQSCARQISRDVSRVLRPRKHPESKASEPSALPGPEPGSKVEQDMAAVQDAAKASLSFNPTDGADMRRLLRAEALFTDSICEPNFRHLRRRPDLKAWKQLVGQTKVLVAVQSVLQGVLEHNARRYPTDGVEALFRHGSTKDLWVESGAALSALLSVLGEWVISENQLDGCAKTGDLLQRIEMRRDDLRKAVLPLVIQLDEDDDHWRPGVQADELFLALTVKQIADEGINVKDAADALGAESEKASNKMILKNIFGWLVFAVVAFGRGVKATFPNLSSPAALRKFLLSPAFQVAVRMLLMVLLLGLLDIFVFSTAVEEQVGGWIFLTAVIVHSPTVEATVAKGFCRILGTVVGAVLGTAPMLSPVFATSPILITVYMLGVTSTVILIFELIPSKIVPRIGYAEQLFLQAFFMASVCAYSPACTENCVTTWQFAVTRSVGIIVGSLVSLLFELFVFPQYAQTEAREKLSSNMRHHFELVKTMTDNYYKKVEEARGKGTYPERLKALAAGVEEPEVPESGKQTENQPSPDQSTVEMEQVLTADMYKDLRRLSTELTSVEKLLGGIHIVTDSWVIARLTLAAPGFLMHLVHLLRSVDLTLYSMSFLSVQEFAVWSGSHWDGWSGRVNRLISKLGLLVKICAQVVFKDVPTANQIEIIQDVRETFAETRAQIRKEAEDLVAPVLPAAKKHLSEHVRAYRIAHPGCEVPSAVNSAAADWMVHQCATFLYEAVEDGFDGIAREIEEYLRTQRETRQKWGQLLSI